MSEADKPNGHVPFESLTDLASGWKIVTSPATTKWLAIELRIASIRIVKAGPLEVSTDRVLDETRPKRHYPEYLRLCRFGLYGNDSRKE